ncbi:hypothetical protein [Actinophytocola sp. NPDC049390]|uniref:hypothetical protein n=1 Tax=Actinophytocola sp. NPDC049390 TaxID=3363894 RepID=UPI0037B5EBAA
MTARKHAAVRMSSRQVPIAAVTKVAQHGSSADETTTKSGITGQNRMDCRREMWIHPQLIRRMSRAAGCVRHW